MNSERFEAFVGQVEEIAAHDRIVELAAWRMLNFGVVPTETEIREHIGEFVLTNLARSIVQRNVILASAA